MHPTPCGSWMLCWVSWLTEVRSLYDSWLFYLQPISLRGATLYSCWTDWNQLVVNQLVLNQLVARWTIASFCKPFVHYIVGGSPNVSWRINFSTLQFCISLVFHSCLEQTKENITMESFFDHQACRVSGEVPSDSCFGDRFYQKNPKYKQQEVVVVTWGSDHHFPGTLDPNYMGKWRTALVRQISAMISNTSLWSRWSCFKSIGVHQCKSFLYYWN